MYEKWYSPYDLLDVFCSPSTKGNDVFPRHFSGDQVLLNTPSVVFTQTKLGLLPGVPRYICSAYWLKRVNCVNNSQLNAFFSCVNNYAGRCDAFVLFQINRTRVMN